jgi:hypothetical protein
VTWITDHDVNQRHIGIVGNRKRRGYEMRDSITNRQKLGIAIWSLLWLVSAAALLQLYLELNA